MFNRRKFESPGKADTLAYLLLVSIMEGKILDSVFLLQRLNLKLISPKQKDSIKYRFHIITVGGETVQKHLWTLSVLSVIYTKKYRHLCDGTQSESILFYFYFLQKCHSLVKALFRPCLVLSGVDSYQPVSTIG